MSIPPIGCIGFPHSFFASLTRIYIPIFRSVSTTHHCQERSPLVLCPDPDAEWKQLLVVDGGGGFNQQQYRMWTFNLFTINGTEEDQHEELR